MSELPGPPPQQPPPASAPPPVGTPVGPPPVGSANQPYPQPLASGMYFDSESGRMLPNGTTLASIGRRIGAYFLAIPLFIVTLGIGYIVWGLILWGRGQTPTFQVLGMRCWRPDTGRVAGWGWMALRELVGRAIVESLAITSIVSLILFTATRERRSLHDYVAGTIVVRDPNKALG